MGSDLYSTNNSPKTISKKNKKPLPIATMFKLPSPLPIWPPGASSFSLPLLVFSTLVTVRAMSWTVFEGSIYFFFRESIKMTPKFSTKYLISTYTLLSFKKKKIP